MTTKNAFIRTRIEPDLKRIAENILGELGITPTQAVTMLYKKIAREHEWPIELKIPNEETQRVMDETDKGIGLISCRNSDDLFEKLGI
jgi:DNA-damage-inducible protein J